MPPAPPLGAATAFADVSITMRPMRNVSPNATTMREAVRLSLDSTGLGDALAVPRSLITVGDDSCGEATMNALETVNQARDALTVRRVYGDPYQEEGVTLIPAATVRGGGGGGGDTRGNGGAGFGLSARPAGAWVIKNGDVSWRPAIDVNRIIVVGQIVAIVALLTARSIAKTLAKR